MKKIFLFVAFSSEIYFASCNKKETTNDWDNAGKGSKTYVRGDSTAPYARRNHFVLLALDHRGLQLMPCPGDASGAEETVSAALAQVQRLMGAIREGSGATVITQTLAAPAVQLFGSLDALTPKPRGRCAG